MPRQQPESSSDHTYRGASQKSANPLPLWNRPRQVFLRGWVGGGSPATAAGSKIRSFQSAENGAAGSGVPAPAGSLAGVAIGVGAAAAAPVGGGSAGGLRDAEPPVCWALQGVRSGLNGLDQTEICISGLNTFSLC